MHPAQDRIVESPSAPPAWTYQPPYTPQAHPQQRYYIRQRLDKEVGLPTVQLLRFAGSEESKLSLRVEAPYGDAELQVSLPRPALLQLRDALNDALHELAQEDEERALTASFERISEEIRQADELGGSGCYYCHPDIHYAAPDQVQAKVAELEAAGTKRYMVLADPTVAQVAA